MKLEIVDNCCAIARRLIAEGLDGAEILEFCRGVVVCLRGRANVFAKFRIMENQDIGPVFVRWRNTLDPLLKGVISGDVRGKDGFIA